MDNNTLDTNETTENTNLAVDIAKFVVVETGKAVVVTAASYAGAFAVLTIAGVAVNQKNKFQARRAAKKAVVTPIVIDPQND